MRLICNSNKEMYESWKVLFTSTFYKYFWWTDEWKHPVLLQHKMSSLFIITDLTWKSKAGSFPSCSLKKDKRSKWIQSQEKSFILQVSKPVHDHQGSREECKISTTLLGLKTKNSPYPKTCIVYLGIDIKIWDLTLCFFDHQLPAGSFITNINMHFLIEWMHVYVIAFALKWIVSTARNWHF